MSFLSLLFHLKDHYFVQLSLFFFYIQSCLKHTDSFNFSVMQAVCEVKVAQSCPTLCNPVDYTVHGILCCLSLLQGIFPTCGGPRCPALQKNSLPAEPQGKPENTGVGSFSLLQWIFPTQESNWGLLHCRRILYQLSYCRQYDLLYFIARVL